VNPQKQNKITWKLQTRFDWVFTCGITKKCNIHHTLLTPQYYLFCPHVFFLNISVIISINMRNKKNILTSLKISYHIKFQRLFKDIYNYVRATYWKSCSQISIFIALKLMENKIWFWSNTWFQLNMRQGIWIDH
jgi:hypothetical protein